MSEADLASERTIRELSGQQPPGGRIPGRGGRRSAGPQRPALGRRSARRHGQLPVRDPPVVRERRGRGCAKARSRARSSTPAGRSCSRRSGRGSPTLHALGPRGRPRALAGSVDGRLWRRAMVATGLAYDAEVRAAQAQVLARVVPRVRDIRRFGSAALDLALDGCGTLRRLLRAGRQAVGRGGGGADLRASGAARGRAPGGGGTAVWRARCRSCACSGRCWSSCRVEIDAAGGIRTHTPFRTRPFEGPASAVPPPPQATAPIYGSSDAPVRSAGLRPGGPGAVAALRARAQRGALELDVPSLREASHREGDQEQLDGHYDAASGCRAGLR